MLTSWRLSVGISVLVGIRQNDVLVSIRGLMFLEDLNIDYPVSDSDTLLSSYGDSN